MKHPFRAALLATTLLCFTASAFGQGITLTIPQDPAVKSQGDALSALTARVTALEKGTVVPPVVGTESPDLTTVPPAAAIVDAAKAKWTIVGGKVAYNGSVIANTSGVTLLKYVMHPVDGSAGGVFQQAGDWWGPMTPTGANVPKVAGDPSKAAPVVVPPPPNGNVPAAAAALGYTTQTFGPLVRVDEQHWFYQNGGPNTVNADGSLTISGGPGYSNNIQTMKLISAGQFKGYTFGCGGFFRVVAKYTGPPPHGVPVPAFWANDWENQDTYAFGTKASWWGAPGVVKPTSNNPLGYYQPGYVDSIEWDMGELNNGYGSWGITIHNWHGQQAQIEDTPASRDGSPIMGLNDQDGAYHTYDGEWVPATATTQGHVIQYFDGKRVGNPIVWNKYDPSKPPPPIEGQNAFSRMDVSHLYWFLGTSGANPFTVKEFSVFQGPGACNIFK